MIDEDFNFPLTRGNDIESYFEITKKLGSGGYGAVYKVKSLSNKNTYAMKVIIKQDEEDEDSEKSDVSKTTQVLIEEVAPHFRVGQRYEFINSLIKYIPKAKFKGKYSKIVIYDLINGFDFEDYPKSVYFEENQSNIRFMNYKFAVQLFSSIYILHKNNIIHSDIKLVNIMYDKTKKDIVLIDFGNSCINKKNYNQTLFFDKAFQDENKNKLMKKCNKGMNSTGSANLDAPEIYCLMVMEWEDLYDIDEDDKNYKSKLKEEKKNIMDNYVYFVKNMDKHSSEFGLDIYCAALSLWQIYNRCELEREKPFQEKWDYRYKNDVPNRVINIINLCLTLKTENRPTVQEVLSKLLISEDDYEFYYENGRYRDFDGMIKESFKKIEKLNN